MADYAAMSDADLLKLVQPQQQQAAPNYSQMPDDELLKLVGGKPKFEASGAVTDIPGEMKRTAQGHIEGIKQGLLNNPQDSAIGGLLNTGKGLLSAAAIIPDTLIGAPARSLFGHTIANTSHTIGSVINPKVAAQDDPQQMYEDIKPGVDQAMSAAMPRGISTVGPRSISAPTPSAAQLKANAVGVFQDPAVKNIPIPTADVANLSGGIENDLLRQGYRPTNGSAPGTFSEIQRMTPDPAVAAVSVDDIRAARRALNMTAKQRDPFGVATPDATAARHAIEAIDNHLDTVAPSIRTANADYSAAKQAEALDFRSIRAEHRAAKSGSGSNIENTMRQEVDKLGNRGLTPQERAARDRIVEGSPARNMLRKMGKLGVDGGLSLTMHTFAGLGSGGASLPITIAGTLARKLGEGLTRHEIAALNRQIRSRAPMARNAAPIMLPQAGNRAKAVAGILAGGNIGRYSPSLLPSVLPVHAEQQKK